jgi:hypothetical protein
VQGAGEQRSHEFYLSKEEVVCPTWRDLKHQSNPESQTECIRSTVGNKQCHNLLLFSAGHFFIL